MYCPSCGSEERQRSQFCRACGTDLRAVRTTLETPDAITASAVSAREQISRVMTEKIAQLESADDLKEIAEDVLPQIEKFLESPEERRLRRVRAGVIVASVGLGATVITFFMAMMKTEMFPFLGLSLITFLIGLGFIINGIVFTVPPKEIPNRLQTHGTSTPPPAKRGAACPSLLSRPAAFGRLCNGPYDSASWT